MKKKLNLIVLLMTLFALTVTSAVSAEEKMPEGRVRLIGQITQIDTAISSFTLETRIGEQRTLVVDDETKYRSPGGQIKSIDDLELAMHVIIFAVEEGDGTLLAQAVGAASVKPEQETMRISGEITGVVAPIGSFSLRAGDGRIVRFETNDHTRYRSHDGAIQGLEDLVVGLKVLVVAHQSERGSPQALIIVAGMIDDLPPIRQYKGELTGVDLSQGLLAVLTEAEQELEFKISERTRFRSPDDDVTSIDDLSPGMHIQIGAIVIKEGDLTALLVSAGSSQRPVLDVKTGGRIVDIYQDGFTIELRNGETRSFVVDETTRYASKNGSVIEFEDLEVGMIALIGAESFDNGGMVVRWISARYPVTKRGLDSTTPSFEREPSNPIAPLSLTG